MPRIPQITAGPAQLGRRASASDVGGGAGIAALGQAHLQNSEIASRLLDAQQTGAVNRSLAESSAELQALELEEMKNPDAQGREKRFQDQAAKIRKKFSRGLFPRYQAAFDNDFGGLSSRSVVKLRTSAWRDTVDSAKASLDLLGREWASRAANETPGASRDQFSQLFSAQLEHSVEGGWINRQEAVARSRKFSDEVMGADVRRMLREDPERLIGILESDDPESPLASMSPEKRMQWSDVAVRRLESNYNRDEANARRIEREEEKAEKERASSATNVLDAILLKGPFSDESQKAYMEVLTDNHDVLSETQRSFYGRRYLAGGGFGSVSTNPVVFTKLSKLARSIRTPAGEEIARELPDAITAIAKNQEEGALSERFRDMVDHAYASELITESHRAQLLQERDEYAFAEAESFLDRTFTPLDDGNDQARVVHGMVLMNFSEFKNRFPNASREEAMKYAVGLAERSIESDLRQSFAKEFHRGFFKMSDDGTIDERASAQAILESDQLTEREKEFQLFQLERAVSMPGGGRQK